MNTARRTTEKQEIIAAKQLMHREMEAAGLPVQVQLDAMDRKRLELEHKIYEIQAARFRLALEWEDWVVQRAAVRLRMPHMSFVQQLKSRHQDLQAEVERVRFNTGRTRSRSKSVRCEKS